MWNDDVFLNFRILWQEKIQWKFKILPCVRISTRCIPQSQKSIVSKRSQQTSFSTENKQLDFFNEKNYYKVTFVL